jgi:hypothetical protein
MNRLFGRFDGDDDLDRVMLVRRNDPFTPPECGEAAIPQIAVWRAGPPRRGRARVSRLAYAQAATGSVSRLFLRTRSGCAPAAGVRMLAWLEASPTIRRTVTS